MSSRLLPDALWDEISPFLPEPEAPSSEGGRTPIENRVVLRCILFVLKTGIAWEDLPLELGCSYKTCKRRMKEWTKAGVWQNFLNHTLSNLRAEDQLDLTDVLVDAGLVKAPLGGQKPARTRQIAVAVAASTT